MVSPIIYNTIGTLGVVLILFGYFALQVDKIDAKKLPYSILNLIGALCILFSLIFEWNFSAFLIESAWFVISVYAIIKRLLLLKKDQ